MVKLRSMWAHGGILLWTFMIVTCAENLALRRPANQTGTYDGLVASRAVDGIYGGSSSQYNCAHPDNYNNGQYSPAEWWVDLEDEYLVETVKVYNTYNSGGYQRLTQFVISVGATMKSLVDCGVTYTGIVPRGSNATITCNIRGRFVHFRRVGGNEISLVTLCEVEVYGRKSIDCSQCPAGVPCDSVGGCSQCSSGKLPPDCTIDCNDYTYGVNCSSTCSRCRYNPCDKSNGLCPVADGCKLWYTGNTCNVYVDPPDRTDEIISPSSMTNATITISWRQIKNLPPVPLGYYMYRLEYREITRSNYEEGPSVKHKANESINTATVTSLQYNTEYYIRIVPYRTMRNEIGWGEAYERVTIKTECSPPDPPAITLSVEDGGSAAQKIIVAYGTIRSLLARCSEITSVWIEYKGQGSNDWQREVGDIWKTSHTLSPSGGGTYDVRVIVGNNGNISSTSETITETIRGPPTTTTTTTTTTAAPATPASSPAKGSADIAIIVPVVLVVVLLVIAVVLVVFFIRKGKIKLPQKKRRPEIIRVDDPGKANAAFIPIPPPSPRDRENHAVPMATKPSVPPRPGTPDSARSVKFAGAPPPPLKPVKVDRPPPIDGGELYNYAAKKKINMKAFGEEYLSLPEADKSRYQLAITTLNKPKNRFANIYAYDENRVILDEDVTGQGDYINANYINGYDNPKEYIATQGARPATVPDLWRMIWQHEANRIVMVANLVDDGKKRCAQYWPVNPGDVTTAGDFTITTEAIEPCADYTTRIFSVKHGNESRTVRQFHFTSWEDKNKPLHGAVTLFAFYNKVRSFDRMSHGPMIVHCSAGVGRTGTFIAFDYLVHQAAAEGQVDIYGCVEQLRRERMLMVQTKEQYFFLHDALAEYLKCGQTSYPCNNFVETFEKINTVSEELGGISEIDRQYNMLTALKTRPGNQGKDGIREANKAKNRTLDIIPDDDSRPYLSTRHKQGNNYINAVFVPSFKEHGHYIVTQMPLPNTIIDFWRLVHDTDCHSVVMLNILDKEDETCQPYWPDEDEPKQRYGPLEVELLKINSENTTEGIITRDFRVILASDKKNIDAENGEEQGLIVRQFQLLSWTKTEDLPSKLDDMLDLFDQLQRWHHQRSRTTNVRTHTVVHCMNGVDRTGIFCASSHTLDRMKIEQEVDAFLAVRYVARKRHQFINNKAQYAFLYKMAIACMSRYDEYANFTL